MSNLSLKALAFALLLANWPNWGLLRKPTILVFMFLKSLRIGRKFSLQLGRL